MASKIYEITTLTAIWTGDIDGKPDRLITTGLLGSVRWWFEVVVRGLGGSACNPSGRSKTCQDYNHCVVCELFGCTGWARKFRFDVLDREGRPPQRQITGGATFQLRFTPLRPIRGEEWALLDLTLRLIADYGALGGKTVYKPTEQDDRKDEVHHRDFGLVRIASSPGDVNVTSRGNLEGYVGGDRWAKLGHNGVAWASLESFWCVQGRTLARQDTDSSSFNRVLGRKEDKSVKAGRGRKVTRWCDLLDEQNDPVARWLAGGRGESKKVFSFKKRARTFGFVNPCTMSHKDMFERLKRVWPDMESQDYVEGAAVLAKLLQATEVS